MGELSVVIHGRLFLLPLNWKALFLIDIICCLCYNEGVKKGGFFVNEKAKKIMHNEAVTLMQMLAIDPVTIAQFREQGVVKNSIEGQPPQELTDYEKNLIREFEHDGRYLVYHVVTGGVDGIGRCVNLLFVATYQEDYPVLEAQASRGLAAAYVHNETIPEYSESGFIQLVRTPYLLRIS